MKKGDYVNVEKIEVEIGQPDVRTVQRFQIYDPTPDEAGFVKIYHYLLNGISAVATIHKSRIICH